MKKFLENNEFENQFESNILYRGQEYYSENRILDIWYQDNNVYAYINGSDIYKVELEIKNGEMKNYYCSCPYSEDGEYLCKHIAAVLYYLSDNEVPELEKGELERKKANKNESKLDEIYDEMQYELNKISDRNGFINYFNGRYFVDLISKTSYQIEKFIDEKNYNDAFELIVNIKILFMS